MSTQPQRYQYHVEDMERHYDTYESASGATLDSFGADGWRVISMHYCRVSEYETLVTVTFEKPILPENAEPPV